MNPEADLKALLSSLRGAQVSCVWQGHGSALFLECGELTESQKQREDGSRYSPKGQWTIDLQFHWRLEQGAEILFASQSRNIDWTAIRHMLNGQVIEEIEASGDIPELTIRLRTGARLMTFSLDGEGPDWTLTDHTKAPPVWIYWRAGALRSDDGTQTY